MSNDLDSSQKIVYYSLWNNDIDFNRSKFPIYHTESQ